MPEARSKAFVLTAARSEEAFLARLSLSPSLCIDSNCSAADCTEIRASSLHAVEKMTDATSISLPAESGLSALPPAGTTKLARGISYDVHTRQPVSCLFCRILARTEPDAVPLVYRDSVCCVFPPRHPDARLHLLVVPWQHVRNVKSLNRKDHSRMLGHMNAVGSAMLEHAAALNLDLLGRYTESVKKLLDSPLPPVSSPASGLLPSSDGVGAGMDGARLVFHVPPFNSIEHLHLHVLAGPFKSWLKAKTFTSGFRWCASMASVRSKL